MKKDTKRMIRYFTISDFEEEEIFLREQHKLGWKFKYMTVPCFYYFEKCEPEDVVYRLDFAEVNNCDRESYKQMFQDEGWEYLCEVNGFTYFRKSKDTEEEPKIFSDIDSKVQFIERVQQRRLLPLICIFLCCVIPQFAQTITRDNIHDGIVGTVLFGVWCVLFVLYLWKFIHCFVRFKKLKDKYQR